MGAMRVSRSSYARTATGLALVLAAGALVWLVFGPVGNWAAGDSVARITNLKDRADAVNAVRQTLLAAIAGLATAAGLTFTARTYLLARRGQLTERYGRAISQLASDKLAERIGGVYALEHVLRESTVDHETVVEVLAAFVRERAPAGSPTADPPSLASDVQAALTVLGRRPVRPESRRLDLARASLAGADLNDARLARAALDGADLRGANLHDADLRDAHLHRSDLRGARLNYAGLQHAYLAEARLDNAVLAWADLTGADLRGATLSGANLAAADLTNADLTGTGTTVDQLRPARFGESTTLDPDLRAAV
ncbi:MAG: hypothetical protein QOI35_1620 [Cryptosporangiaceae bacterium]|nr:hypothetical protein [Cryptosporangiaceae bacterium]